MLIKPGDSLEGNIKAKRILAAVIDLVGVPILIGLVLGISLVVTKAGDSLREQVLERFNYFFTAGFFRDFVYSPGRHLCGLELVDAATKVRICFYRGPFFSNLWKAFLRSALLIVPFVLVIGYVLEIISILWKGRRIGDRWAGTEIRLR